jgi:hypothetical protein
MKRYIVIASMVWLSVIPFAAAQTTYWTGTGTGWSGAGSWSSGEPTASIRAGVNFGTATVTDPGEICKSLQLGGGAGNWNGNLAMSSGSLDIISQLTVGYVGTGTATLTGGLLKAATIVISVFNNTPCSMDVSGNAEVQCQYLEVGWPGKGYLTQSGGTITTNELALTNNNDDMRGEAYYTLNGGTLNVGAVYVGIIKGEFKVTNTGATINITDGFDIRPNGTLIAPAGTILHLKGAKFSCKKTVSSEIPDLANLTLSFESAGGRESRLEAAGMDRGANPSVLTDNFAVDTVTLEPGVVLRLINEVGNNPPNPVVSDVAVTRQLNLGDGSTLILGGVKMYCQDWTNTCGTVDWRNGGRLYVLNASYDMTMTASPSEIGADGQSESEISTVLTDRGVPICNAYVRFNTDKGTLIAEGTGGTVWAKTDAGGRATARLRSDTQTGKATVTASYMDFSKQATVDFIGLNLSVTADPAMIPADGVSRSTVTATLTNMHNPVSGMTIHLHTPQGGFVGEGAALVSDIDVVTNGQGHAVVQLQSGTEPIAFLITATYQDLQATDEVRFVAEELFVEAEPTKVLADGSDHSIITARLTHLGQPIAGETIHLSTTLGRIVTPGSGTLVASIDLVTDASGQAIVNLVSDTIGDSTVTATHEDLTASTDVHFAMTLLTLAADPDKITADGTETSIVTATLLIDGQSAQGETIWFHTTVGQFRDPVLGDLTSDTWALTGPDGQASVDLVPINNQEESGLVSAEYIAKDLHDTCIVEMRNYSLKLTAEKAFFGSIPGTAEPTILSFPISYQDSTGLLEFAHPCVTLFGLTVIPVDLELTGPTISGKSIHLASEMKDLYGDHITFLPETVITDEYGKASFKIHIQDIYEDFLSTGSLEQDQGSFQIDLKVSLEDRPEISDTMDFPVFNNYLSVVKTFERNALDGYLWNLTDPYNIKYWSMAWPLIVSGVWAGDVNNALDAIWTIDGLITGIPSPYGPFTCGCYQLMTLEIWDRMRLNQYGMTTSWLMNGFDYGPVKVLWGGHQAAMIWPHNKSWVDPFWCRVYDAWIKQHPQGAQYSLTDWLYGMGIVIPVVGYIMDTTLEPGSSNFYADTSYPPKSYGTYPGTIITGPDCGGQRVPYAYIVLHCPVNVMVSNETGQRVGVVPGTPEGHNPYLNEIGNAEFYPQRLPDGSMAYGLRIPRQKMNIDVSGYADGEFSMILQDGNGKVFGYSEAPIQIDQHVVADLEPNSLMAPAIVYPDGSRILPDGVIEIDAWTYDSDQHRSKGTLKITNTTATAVHGPLRLIVESTTPDTITLVNPDGTDDAKPYLDLTALLGDGRLDPGESVSRTIEFSNPNREYFDMSVKLTGRTAEDKKVTARRKFKQVGIPKCSRDGLLPFDLAEGNAADWETWAADMEPQNTYAFDEFNSKVAGNASVMCVTDAPFDMYIRYGKTLTEPWDLSMAKNLFISFFAANGNDSFQSGSPWIRLKTDDENYFELQYFRDGWVYEILNDQLGEWKPYVISLDAPDNEDNGWRRTTVGSPDWSQIRYLEIHADTWGAGFTMGVDGVGFDTDRAIYRDFNTDCSVDTLDLVTLAKHWLCPACTPVTCEGADIDLSGKVDLADFALFAETWLEE